MIVPKKYRKRFSEIKKRMTNFHYPVSCSKCGKQWRFGGFMFSRCPNDGEKPDWEKWKKDISNSALRTLQKEIDADNEVNHIHYLETLAQQALEEEKNESNECLA